MAGLNNQPASAVSNSTPTLPTPIIKVAASPSWQLCRV
nr:MAG TPA: hypothetical protein [Caudoviricetes sp.]